MKEATRDMLVGHPLWPVLQPVYSAGVWASAFGLMGVGATTAVLLHPWVKFRDAHWFFAGITLGGVVPITGSQLSVEFHPGFDPERRGVFCQNHVNVFDGHVAAASLPHAFVGLMEAWHFKIPAYGWLMNIAESIPVPAKRTGRTKEMADALQDRVGKGLSLLVFPEAHRTRDGHVARYKRGVFFMARDAGVPVVPVGVRGAYEVNRKGDWKFTPGHIRVFVGPQFETAGLSDDEVGRLSRRFQRMTAAYVETGVMPVDDVTLGDAPYPEADA